MDKMVQYFIQKKIERCIPSLCGEGETRRIVRDTRGMTKLVVGLDKERCVRWKGSGYMARNMLGRGEEGHVKWEGTGHLGPY